MFLNFDIGVISLNFLSFFFLPFCLDKIEFIFGIVLFYKVIFALSKCCFFVYQPLIWTLIYRDKYSILTTKLNIFRIEFYKKLT